MNNNELQHHGVKGMRWGVRRTPAQLGHRPTTTKKKLFGGVAKKKQTTSDKSKELSTEEKKAKVLKSRSAKELFDNAHLFNDKELNDAYNRLNLEKNIKNLIETTPSRAEQLVNATIKWGGKISDLAKNVDSAYINVTKLGKHLGLIDDADGSKDTNSSTNAGSKKSKNKKKTEEPESADKKKTDDPKKTENAKDKKTDSKNTDDPVGKKSPETKKSKPNTDDDVRTGEVFDSPKKNRDSDSDSGSRSSKTYDTIWVTDYQDLTPTSRSRDFVSTNYSNTTISGLLGGSSLPAMENRVAGYLAPPKDDD